MDTITLSTVKILDVKPILTDKQLLMQTKFFPVLPHNLPHETRWLSWDICRGSGRPEGVSIAAGVHP